MMFHPFIVPMLIYRNHSSAAQINHICIFLSCN